MNPARILPLSLCLLALSPAWAHEVFAPKPKPEAQEPNQQKVKQKDKTQEKEKGKPTPVSGRTALAEAESGERFCMQNREGKVHCIPFGAH